MTRLTAELRADAGAAAADDEFFRAAAFLRAEGVTHSLVIGDGRVVLPVIRREIPGGGHDAISPYGYPGGRVTGEPLDVTDVDFGGTGLVSLFVRERLGRPSLAGGRDTGRVLLHDPALPGQIQRRVATKIRSNERQGYATRWTAGPDVDGGAVADFHAAYTDTMRGAGAAPRYFFPVEYLRTCLTAPASWLVTVTGPDGDLAAAAIAVVSDGYLHYYLGGTADRHRSASPAKNLMAGMVDLADKLTLPLNLGGGMRQGDSLETFKASFANSESTFVSHGIVCDPAVYARLAGGPTQSDFFPAYRAPQETTT